MTSSVMAETVMTADVAGAGLGVCPGCGEMVMGVEDHCACTRAALTAMEDAACGTGSQERVQMGVATWAEWRRKRTLGQRVSGQVDEAVVMLARAPRLVRILTVQTVAVVMAGGLILAIHRLLPR